MPSSTVRVVPALGLALLLGIASVQGAASPASTPTPQAPARPPASPFSSAKTCGACHDTIHKAWAESAHARSATSPAYLEALQRVVEPAADKKAARAACIWCHAPTTIATGDVDLQQPISKEGITCDFCHTVADIEPDKVPPFDSKPGPLKRGPFGYSGKVAGHPTVFSPLHRGPALCAPCHEFKNAQGVLVLSNYSEWRDGPYPQRGVTCQDCHMALVPGTVARGTASTKPAARLVNLHRLVGGSAVSQLARGLELKFESVTSEGGSAEVVVVVTNAAAGHSIPGGLATKSLVLTVGAETADGKLDYKQERVYRRELKDDKGVVLETVADQFLRAASVGSDSRIGPKDSRREHFTIPVPSGARAIVARLVYRDASDPRNAEPTLTLVTEVKHPLGTK